MNVKIFLNQANKYWIVTDKQAKPDFTFLYLDFVKFGFSF